VIDGGTGSELERRGVPLRRHDVWSGLAALEHFDVLREVHRDYIRAGARVITTNTFGTSRFVLEAAGFGDRFREINALAVAAALQARDASEVEVSIAGSISCLPPRFDVRGYPDAATEKAAYRELAEVLIEKGADFIALEMLQDDVHARLACEAVVEAGLPFWLGVSCRLGAHAGTLVAFDFPQLPFAVALDALLPYRPGVVCVMHSPIDAIALAIDAIETRWNGPIGAYPEVDAAATTAEQFAALARQWRERGVNVLGGCCGTTPAHIAALEGLP
jgi:S-methylmethionine-dependent homocysteine/selenocysteine methylase